MWYGSTGRRNTICKAAHSVAAILSGFIYAPPQYNFKKDCLLSQLFFKLEHLKFMQKAFE